ncbi:hypothetical protein ABZT02_45295 [Streptomyces sp. NPDC005402]|uniref:hypothetical protein n=1 Tax=Streptomyces sp. NPDC005402 TaxID=3155338 RepID=UPI0033B087C8
MTKGKTSFGMDWASKLPDPTVKDNTASDDLGDGQTLKVVALAQGFSEDLVLGRQPTDPTPTYRIPLDLHGLTLSQADSGYLLLKERQAGCGGAGADDVGRVQGPGLGRVAEPRTGDHKGGDRR